MSNFAGVTFANQHISPADDAVVRRAVLADGILTGCDVSFSGAAVTMAAGCLLLCGRQINHTQSQSWDMSGSTSGFARLLLTIDLTRTATEAEFDQVVDAIEYADTVEAFAPLVQEDINASGTRYQVAAFVAALSSAGVSGIESKLDRIGNL